MTKLYKFLREGMESESGKTVWKVGEWQKEKGALLCNYGFHASKTPSQAFAYVQGEIVAEVEVRGESDIQEDKECWSEMRLVSAKQWRKEDSVAISIFAAELCLKNFEVVYPNDKRPREAIEAAKKWIAEPTKENGSAAWSAAWSAARSAAWSARSAAWSARSAAWSARSAAWSAAWSAKKKIAASIDKWMVKRIKTLPDV